MSARPVPVQVRPRVMYAVMTAEPLDGEDLLPPPSPELLRHYGSSDEALLRLRSRPHQRLLLRETEVERATQVVHETRLAALALAEEHDGVVIDLAVPRVVPERPAEVSLSHATQWYVVDHGDLGSGVLTTVGLSSFGLPEVVLEGVDPQGHAMFSAVLAGLVRRLIAEWPAHDPVGRATVTLRDIAHGLGDPQASRTPRDRAVELEIGYDDTAHVLRVTLRDDPALTLFAP